MTSLGVEVRDGRSNSWRMAPGRKRSASRQKRSRRRPRVGQSQTVRANGRWPPTRARLSALDNKLYLLAGSRLLDRKAFRWKDGPDQCGDRRRRARCRRGSRGDGGWAPPNRRRERAVIPGEVSGVVLGQGARHGRSRRGLCRAANVEPAIYKQFAGAHRMLIGLANDEIGYIIRSGSGTRRRRSATTQEGAVRRADSVGPEAAPLMCEASQH